MFHSKPLIISSFNIKRFVLIAFAKKISRMDKDDQNRVYDKKNIVLDPNCNLTFWIRFDRKQTKMFLT